MSRRFFVLQGHEQMLPSFENVLITFKNQSKLIKRIAICFVVSLLVGMTTAKWGPDSIESWSSTGDAASNEQVEMIFGRFRDSLRDGEVLTIAACVLIVFGLNTLASVMSSLSTVFIVPLVFQCVGWWIIGLSLPGLHGSSSLSVFLFLLMAGLEWVTYVLSVSAGMNIGLAVISPRRVEADSRWLAFKHALSQAGHVYVLIILILAIQAIFEVLYVRKVLLMGGSGIPLAPW